MSAPLLDVRNLSTVFPIKRGMFSRTVGALRAVDNVSLQIAPGEALGLVGESGCGKSTLARTLLLLEKAESGTVHFGGASLLEASPVQLRQIRRRIQVVFQDPFASLNPGMTVADLVTEGLVAHGLLARRNRQQVAAELLHEVGLGPDACNRFPHAFSGGQRQRISIARALSLQPSLLICDEAVSALDVSVQAQIINLLMHLRQTYKLAFLFISHDLSIVAHFCDRIAVMYLGKIVEQGPARDLIREPRHPYTMALLQAIPKVGGARRERLRLSGDVPSPLSPPSGCPFHPRCRFAIDRCRREGPGLEPAGQDLLHLSACHRRNDPAVAPPTAD